MIIFNSVAFSDKQMISIVAILHDSQVSNKIVPAPLKKPDAICKEALLREDVHSTFRFFDGVNRDFLMHLSG